MTIFDIAKKIVSHDLSPVELIANLLTRIEQKNPTLNAFVTLTAERAVEEAKIAETEIMKGNYKGPLHGIPIVHKDLYHTQGIRTTASSKVLEHFVPTEDATVVRKLKDAGTILLGKVQTHEFAAGGFTDSKHFGPCLNPWDMNRIPGGSSGGSAASVAAGLTFMATGTDTAGSIRNPAACCGIVGIKPTYGRVSRKGIIPLSWSLDHSGPMTRSVKDAALTLQVMAGYDSEDATSASVLIPVYNDMLRSDLKGIKIGIPTNYFLEGLNPEVKVAVSKAIDRLCELGAEIVEVSLQSMSYAMDTVLTIALSEMASIHSARFANQRSDFGEDVQKQIELGQAIPAALYLQAHRVRNLIQGDFMNAFSSVDAIVTPTMPIFAPLRNKVSSDSDLIRFTLPANLANLPALSLPCGFSAEGMPIGLQFIGKPFAEG
ncbi:amidase, partial [Streptomyces sp. NPDC057052]|uniref:amidase n=1 Tax=Streptomyces sp. NPDC057052 TaxID=3346010 RepID=UPI00362E584A